ncbi:MAG TPA: hypothetical protein VGH31_11915 [Acidimicrobiales bacterium]
MLLAAHIPVAARDHEKDGTSVHPRHTLSSIALAVAATTVLSTAAGAAAKPFLSQLGSVTQVGSTVPANGDVNPYGVAVVAASSGKLVQGDTLVSNFNSKANVQGTGSTIVELSPQGKRHLFAQVSMAQLPAGSTCPGGIGLSTALGILPGGWVVVGSLPSQLGGALSSANPAGCMVVLNNEGAVVETFTNPNIDGPWDMAVATTPTGANLFIANALGGNTKVSSKGVPVTGQCTIVRLNLTTSASAPPVLVSSTVIGNDYPWKADKDAFVLAPTGVALSSSDTLLVTNTLSNSVSAIPDASSRTTALSQAATTIFHGGHLNAPLGMMSAPNGDVIIVNGNDGVATELSPGGKPVASRILVRHGAGDLFGLALTANGKGILFVNDGSNALDLVQVK